MFQYKFLSFMSIVIVGSFDFIVFNYYKSVKVRPMTEEELSNEPNLKRRDRGFSMSFENISPEEVISYYYIYHYLLLKTNALTFLFSFNLKNYEGFLNCLKWINKVMDKPKIFIGENGFPEDEGADQSTQKIAYHTVSIIKHQSASILITLKFRKYCLHMKRQFCK